MTTYTVEIEELSGTDEVLIRLPDAVVEHLGMKVGDTLNWDIRDDGTIVLTKAAETELVLVECISSFRTRYLVEVPKGQKDWALDSVVMQDVPEFSQKHIDESPISHRVVSAEEAQTMYEDDNPELKGTHFRPPRLKI